MNTLLAQMEAELNKLAKQKQDAYKLGSSTQFEVLAEIQKKQVKLRALIGRYAAIQAEYLELNQALSIY